MILDLFFLVLFLFYVFFELLTISGLEEHIQRWRKDRERVRQLRWESKQVHGILHNMYEEGVLEKLTSIERIELHEILAREYPVWYSIYGKEMIYIPRNL